MKQRPFVLTSMLLLFVASWGFGFFYHLNMGIRENNSSGQIATPSAAPVVAPKEVFPEIATDYPCPTPENLCYRVQAQNDHIYIFELHQDDTIMQLEDVKIEFALLREEDKRLLENGIDVSSLTEAEAILENFME